jgi:DNA-binding transcriptional MerR regulator
MAGKPYDNKDLQLIARMRDEGVSISVIARSLGRTQAGIQGALRARGWVDPARSEAMRCVHKFTAEERRTFQEFIYSHRPGYTASDIRDEWNKEAVVRGWPTTNNYRVLHYRRRFGLQPPKSDCLQFESYRKKQSTAQRARRTKEREARLQALRRRRAELYATEPDLKRRKCHACLETWPLTQDFFCSAGSAGNSKRYYLNTCKICYRNPSGKTVEERRSERMELYDRNVAVKQISHARCERDAFLREHRNFPTRRCSRCYETWELVPARFPVYNGAGGQLYRKTCRFCLRAAERLRDRAKKVSSRFALTNSTHRDLARVI